MPTTGGSLSLAGYTPVTDAAITQKLRSAGAIILAKVNLHEFAIWGETVSSIQGQTLNPYDLTRTPGGIVNNANFASGAVAPGSIVSIFGSGLAPSTQLFSGFPLTTSLGGVTVSVNGVNAPIFYASPSQINIQVPFETVPDSAMIAVNSSCGSSGQVQVQVAQAAPYILQTVTGQGEAQAIVQNYNASTGQYTLNGPDNPAKVGSLVVAYLIGIGPVSNPPADGAAAPTTSVSPSTLTYSSTIGGWTTPLNNYPFLGLAPGWVGLDQANLTVPVGLSTGQYSVVITVGGVSSQTTPAPTMFVTE